MQHKDSYAAPKPEISYKPYTLRDYESIKESNRARAGGLGPDTENSNYKVKVSYSVWLQWLVTVVQKLVAVGVPLKFIFLCSVCNCPALTNITL